MKKKKTDYDSPWKTVIEKHFSECIQFYYPDLYTQIDWSHPPRFLDQELRQIALKDKNQLRRLDKLVELRFLDHSIEWVLIHLEVQNQKDDSFVKRMFIYHYRIFEKYGRHPISLALLTDSNEKWRPHQYQHTQGGCELILTFPMVKLWDYKQDEKALETHSNLFALVTLAHLRGLTIKKSDEEQRYATKKELFRLLLCAGYSQQRIVDLYRFIDWIITLPDGLDKILTQDLYDSLEGVPMEYVSVLERRAEKKGKIEGKLEGKVEMLLRLLTRKFNELPVDFVERLKAIDDGQRLDELFDSALFINSLEELPI